MNRLLKKIRDFGLVFSIPSEDPETVIRTAGALKKAHVPLILLPSDTGGNELARQANGSLDLFIATAYPSTMEEISRTFASGAHFSLIRPQCFDEVEKALSSGFDVYPMVETENQAEEASRRGFEAVVISRENSRVNPRSLALPFFLDCRNTGLPPGETLAAPGFIAAILTLDPAGKSPEEITEEASHFVRELIGFEYKSLTLTGEGERREEAEIFAALSAIPLAAGGERDCLELEVADMDRAVAYLKWRNIFIDPFSARMEGERMVSADVYSTINGWAVRLVTRRT